MTTLDFPDGFLWGTATAAHQVEGGNWNSDWWAWEHDPQSLCVEPSGDACDHLFRFDEDIALLAELGFNAYRFSVEWARIEPESGEFSRQWTDHYRRMADSCRSHGVDPVVTLHHFTSPRWVAAEGGWETPGTAERFARYVEHLAPLLADVSMVCTINEPNIVAMHGYRTGVFPPGKRDSSARRRANDTFIAAHRLGRDAVRAASEAPVGLTLSMTEWEATPGGEERLARYREPMEDVFLDAAVGDDFIGVQTYTRTVVGPEGVVQPGDDVETTLMGYEFRPEALEATIRRAYQATGGTPIVVTENGIACRDDEDRIRFVAGALAGVGRCIADGIDVRGYVYWSLMDNFEWAFGYEPTFGLVAVDRQTMDRNPKPSARWLGQTARANRLAPTPGAGR